MSCDERTRESAIDAAISKYSAVKKGYMPDDFIELFINSSTPHPKKMPLINRGTYARQHCIQTLLNQVHTLTSTTNTQIILLGAGIDSLALNIKQSSPLSTIYEIDFPDTIDHKLRYLRNGLDKLQAIWPNDTLTSTSYGSIHFIPADLRDAPRFLAALQSSGCSPSVPTVIISECVLVYLPKTATLSLCTALGEYFTEALWVSYDMFSPADRFGVIMQQNIASQGYSVPGFHDFPTLLTQEERFISSGWSIAKALSMMTAFYAMVTREEQRRVSRLEMMDEVEEWHMLMSHYCLTVALKGTLFASVVDTFGSSVEADKV